MTPVFETGFVVNGQWRVEKLIGKGAFGIVYEVTNISSKKKAALKAEPKTKNKLRKEIEVLNNLKSSENIPRLYASGHTPIVNYMVMQLLGKTLSFLRQSRPDGALTMNTNIRIAIELIQAVKSVHLKNFIHRDIKPGNFATGNEPGNARNFYIFDFGLAEPFHSTRRMNIGFHGTPRYASLEAFEKHDQSYRDDMWSLLYTLLECVYGPLIWKGKEEKEIIRLKKAYNEFLPSKLKKLPSAFLHYFNIIKALQYSDIPPYDDLAKAFEDNLKERKISKHEPYDWEVKQYGIINEIDGDETNSMAKSPSGNVDLENVDCLPFLNYDDSDDVVEGEDKESSDATKE